MALLSIIGLMLMKMALNVMVPRQWTMLQAVTDAYMTYEKAYAQRATFSDIVADGSPWPQQPASTATQVEVGRLPGGQVVMGTVSRTRVADSNNHPTKGGTLTEADWKLKNPAALEVWKLQSVLTYEVSGRTYVKARTVVRTR